MSASRSLVRVDLVRVAINGGSVLDVRPPGAPFARALEASGPSVRALPDLEALDRSRRLFALSAGEVASDPITGIRPSWRLARVMGADFKAGRRGRRRRSRRLSARNFLLGLDVMAQTDVERCPSRSFEKALAICTKIGCRQQAVATRVPAVHV